jgi:hypothetical protein
LNISSVTIVGTGATQFVIADDTGETTLAPGATRTIWLSFNPDSTGPHSANLRILSNDSSEGTIDVALSGTGLDQEITVSPLTLSFGSQDIDAVDEWIKKHGQQEKREQVMASIAALPRGTAWVWAPGWP